MEPRNTETAVLFVAAGFEPRSVAYLNDCAEYGRRYHRVVVIEYAPTNKTNRYADALAWAKVVGGRVDVTRFDRFYPFQSTGISEDALSGLCEGRTSGCGRVGYVAVLGAGAGDTVD